MLETQIWAKKGLSFFPPEWDKGEKLRGTAGDE